MYLVSLVVISLYLNNRAFITMTPHLKRSSHDLRNSAIRMFHVFRDAAKSSEGLSIGLATAWEAQALFDALIFAMTLARTLKMRKMHDMVISVTGERLMDIILRDGK